MLAVAASGIEDPVNLCTGVGTSMFELALIAARRAGHHAAVASMPGKPEGVAYRVGDPALFHSIYRPKVSLREGVARALRA
jgi:nucleoside-diphosphate-sugar epimerase